MLFRSVSQSRYLRLRLLTATPSLGHSFSRSYGANLPSSWTYHHPSALEYSSRPPVSVCGTDTSHSLEDFPGSRPGGFASPDLELTPDCNHCAPELARCVPPSVLIVFRWSRNINRVSISYAFRPHLRLRLTLSGLTFLRNP